MGFKVYYTRLYSISKEYRGFIREISNRYVEAYGEKSYVKSKKSVECFCYNVVKAVIFNTNKIRVTSDRNRFSKIVVNGKLVDTGVGYTATINIFKMLHTAQLISYKKGYKDLRSGDSKSGSIELSKEFKSLVKAYLKNPYHTFNFHSNSIIVRDTEWGDTTFTNSKAVRSLKQGVENYNKFMKNICIRDPKGVHYPIHARRVFSRSDFNNNGRCYLDSGSVQALPSRERKHLSIDGSEVVEIDFKAMHLAIIYTKLGIPWSRSYDPYRVWSDHVLEDYELIDACKSSTNSRRNLTKTAILVMLNAKDKKQAINAIKWEYKEDFQKGLQDRKFIGLYVANWSKFLDDVANYHSCIRDWLYCDAGIKLMRLDSDIMARTLDDCVKENIPVIPVHDSCICKKSDINFVIESMRKNFESVCGSADNCVLEVKDD